MRFINKLVTAFWLVVGMFIMLIGYIGIFILWLWEKLVSRGAHD